MVIKMEKVIEALDPYIVLQNLCGNEYKIETGYVDFGNSMLKISRDIRYFKKQEIFLEIYFFNDSIYLELKFDLKSEKNKIKKMDLFFEQNKQSGWWVSKLINFKKYAIIFLSEDNLLNFLEEYVMKG